MPRSMVIPSKWLAEAGVQDFKPLRSAFRCDKPHVECVALADIEMPLRNSGYTLDANGFEHDRMAATSGGRDDRPGSLSGPLLRGAADHFYSRRVHSILILS